MGEGHAVEMERATVEWEEGHVNYTNMWVQKDKRSKGQGQRDMM